MLTVSGLSIFFAEKYLFDNVSFAVKPKDRIGLVGKNGAGKSTLLKIISGLQSAEKGSVAYPNNFKIGYLPQDGGSNSEVSLFQEASSSLTEIKTLEKRIAEITEELTVRTDYESDEYSNLIVEMTEANERFDMLGGGASESEVVRILSGLGFTQDDMERPVNTFSGGWQMRLELAKILLSAPDVILLDEPTNHLDIESIIWLEDFLNQFLGSVMIVSHDKRFLDNVTNRTIEIVRGKIFDLNYPYSKFVEQRKDQVAIQIAAKKNQDKAIEQQERFIERFKAKARFASRTQSKAKLLEKIERIEVDDEETSKIKFRFPEAPRSGRVICEVKKLTKRYDDKVVLKDIDFALERGDKVAFVGKNGEGKSTLSKIMAGVLDYDGDMEMGHNVKMGYFAQHQAHILPDDQTPFEVIDNAAKDEMRTKVRNLLGAFLFSGDDVYKKVKVLSGGEKGRLALAKLLLEPSNMLIMDEPTNHLDMTSKDVLKEALLNYEGALVIVSHDRDFLQGLTNKTIYFKGGQIKEYLGTVDEFIDSYKVESLDDLGESNKQKANTQVSNKQQQNNNTPSNNRTKTTVGKEIAIIEADINLTETKINNFEKMFAMPDFYSDVDKATQIETEYKELKKKLEKLMQNWESANQELESIS